ncbi:MAG: hypothetical protein E6315_07715 [Peptoniphilus harei]|nr:hypothetical protein [Peptoniphilus harei]
MGFKGGGLRRGKRGLAMPLNPILISDKAAGFEIKTFYLKLFKKASSFFLTKEKKFKLLFDKIKQRFYNKFIDIKRGFYDE